MLYIYSNLRWIRDELKLSQNAFADLLDLNVSNICRWENSKNGMSLETALLISERLNIPISDLVGKDISLSGDKYIKSIICKKNNKQ
ncbi:MAG: helix-turn-helix transcriptional regulator [Mycoplasma sp.]|nr:helix-turn-helix transcriptional regulator [Mycoplasma sp.]